MLEFGIGVPANQLIIDTLAAEITYVISFFCIECCRLIRIIVLDRVICGVIGMNVYFIFADSPLSI